MEIPWTSELPLPRLGRAGRRPWRPRSLEVQLRGRGTAGGAERVGAGGLSDG